MKILVFGAAGDVGRRIVSESIRRSHRVTAVARRPTNGLFPPSVEVRILDVASTPNLAAELAGQDLVISALRPPDGEEASLVSLTRAVVEAARTACVGFIVVGGAAVLRVPGMNGHTVLTAPGFLPEAVIPIATACHYQYEAIRDRLDPLGAYLCPPGLLVPGERTGRYRRGTDTLVVDEAGESRISVEDFAVALLDEAEHPQNTGRRFTVGT